MITTSQFFFRVVPRDITEPLIPIHKQFVSAGLPYYRVFEGDNHCIVYEVRFTWPIQKHDEIRRQWTLRIMEAMEMGNDIKGINKHTGVLLAKTAGFSDSPKRVMTQGSFQEFIDGLQTTRQRLGIDPPSEPMRPRGRPKKHTFRMLG